MAQFNFEAIGTKWQIDIYEKDLSSQTEKDLFRKVMERIDVFDKAYSRFRTDSLVTKMSKESGTFILPHDAEPMMALYHDLYLRTDGLFTPLVGNLLSDAGYDAQYSLQQKKPLETPPAWDDVLSYRFPELIMKRPAMLDFGAAGKGYLIDIVAEVLEENGVHTYCVDAGGDILYKNTEPIRVGLEDPENTGQVVGVCTLLQGSICGSAGNRRAWGNFTHIIDPKNLVSPRDILAVWVTASTAMLADAIATCLFFAPAGIFTGAYDFEYVLMRSDRSVERSAGFSGELFTAPPAQ